MLQVKEKDRITQTVNQRSYLMKTIMLEHDADDDANCGLQHLAGPFDQTMAVRYGPSI
jgi:hypothetical protein